MPSLNKAEQDRVESLYTSVKEGGGRHSSVNEAGFSHFSRLGYPGRKAEMFTYVNTHKLGLPAYGGRAVTAPDSREIKNFIPTGFENRCLVMTGGVYNESLSEISALSAQIIRVGEEVSDEVREEHRLLLIKSTDRESDPFAALNAAFVEETLLIDLSKTSEKNRRLQILFDSSTNTNHTELALSPRVLITIPSDTEVEMLVRFIGSSQNVFLNGFQDIVLGPNSTLHYIVDQSDTSVHPLFMKSRITIKEGSQCLLTQALSGGKLTRFNHEVILAGPEAVFESRLASVITGQEEAHVYSTVSHQSPSGKSNQYFNNIVLGKGRTSVDTTVEVQKSGGGAVSGQLIKNTLLTYEGRADAKPNLKIFADDVKCQHGATTGCLDEKQIFYMQSRGISKKAAENAIVSGLVESMLTDIRDPELGKSIREKLLRKIEDKDVTK